ncbi:hypothetical protein BDP81DRAFT_430558 [Colletotrichum phormii]|uniref:Uncharacterized protein n=1 Tax=Colletotrichum phormii TaxID=359342 RepID=A0AAI9ZQC7_9PEZI|nr:uncharacterized protein BDP81DRAFT_430558 [Colletotrichum phormii]KAK1635910.1 hypothetical protein BDP81DRAFT_430558 [Colletotrichum phormii]
MDSNLRLACSSSDTAHIHPVTRRARKSTKIPPIVAPFLNEHGRLHRLRIKVGD